MNIARLVVISALLAPVCRADDGMALAGKLLDASGVAATMQQSFEVGIKPSLDRMKAQGMPAELVESIHAASLKFFNDNFNWQEMRPQMEKLYADSFSEAELRDMVAFYESPTGQKAAAKLPSLMQQAAAMSMGRVQSKMPQFQQQIGALIQDYQKKAAAATVAPAAPTQTPK